MAEDGTVTGLDLDAFKKSNEYLFSATQTVTTAASSTATSDSADTAALREAAGLPPK